MNKPKEGLAFFIDLSRMRDASGRDELFADVVVAGFSSETSARRLDFHRMCEHALRYGNDPAALLAANVRAARWYFGTSLGDDSDERRAMLKMKRWE